MSDRYQNIPSDKSINNNQQRPSTSQETLRVPKTLLRGLGDKLKEKYDTCQYGRKLFTDYNCKSYVEPGGYSNPTTKNTNYPDYIKTLFDIEKLNAKYSSKMDKNYVDPRQSIIPTNHDKTKKAVCQLSNSIVSFNSSCPTEKTEEKNSKSQFGQDLQSQNSGQLNNLQDQANQLLQERYKNNQQADVTEEFFGSQNQKGMGGRHNRTQSSIIRTGVKEEEMSPTKKRILDRLEQKPEERTDVKEVRLDINSNQLDAGATIPRCLSLFNYEFFRVLENYKIHDKNYFGIYPLMEQKQQIDLAFHEKVKQNELLHQTEDFMNDGRAFLRSYHLSSSNTGTSKANIVEKNTTGGNSGEKNYKISSTSPKKRTDAWNSKQSTKKQNTSNEIQSDQYADSGPISSKYMRGKNSVDLEIVPDFEGIKRINIGQEKGRIIEQKFGCDTIQEEERDNQTPSMFDIDNGHKFAYHKARISNLIGDGTNVLEDNTNSETSGNFAKSFKHLPLQKNIREKRMIQSGCKLNTNNNVETKTIDKTPANTDSVYHTTRHTNRLLNQGPMTNPLHSTKISTSKLTGRERLSTNQAKASQKNKFLATHQPFQRLTTTNKSASGVSKHEHLNHQMFSKSRGLSDGKPMEQYVRKISNNDLPSSSHIRTKSSNLESPIGKVDLFNEKHRTKNYFDSKIDTKPPNDSNKNQSNEQNSPINYIKANNNTKTARDSNQDIDNQSRANLNAAKQKLRELYEANQRSKLQSSNNNEDDTTLFLYKNKTTNSDRMNVFCVPSTPKEKSYVHKEPFITYQTTETRKGSQNYPKDGENLNYFNRSKPNSANQKFSSCNFFLIKKQWGFHRRTSMEPQLK